MSKKMILVGGSKGGVGKSIVSSAVIDVLRQRGEKLLVIDSDTSNPDVYKSHHKTIECMTLDLDRKDGWLALLNAAYNTDATVVINSAARNNQGVDTFGCPADERAVRTRSQTDNTLGDQQTTRQPSFAEAIPPDNPGLDTRRAKPARGRTRTVRAIQWLKITGGDRG